MRNIFLMLLLSFSCSTLQLTEKRHREIAGLKAKASTVFDLQLTPAKVFANGANKVVLKIEINNAEVNPADLKLFSDIAIESSNFTKLGDSFFITIKPKVKSPNIKLKVIWKDTPSQIIILETTLEPLTDKMMPLKTLGNSAIWTSGLYYTRQDDLPEGQFEGFKIDNNGGNPIVNAVDSRRDFDFEYEEQARQNIGLFVSDSPNSTVSHTMHSMFMFFPRTYLPYAEINKKEVTVTLPTGEKMTFAESGEIIDGVFEEGPVDVGPDRFKRSYADLKYQGKGILLRANARGQMPQQGQFESTKIDQEYGNKFSADVLIINGTTGQRCRRPKIDFWSSEDVSPVLFKFPSDKDFDSYLKDKCKFGIPNLEIKEIEVKEENISEISSDIWKKCIQESKIKFCINAETKLIENPITQSRVIFDLEALYIQAKENEAEKITPALETEVFAIRTILLSEATWTKNQNCVEKSKTLIQTSFKFHDINQLIQNRLTQNCSNIKDEMDQIAGKEVSSFKEKLETNSEWMTTTTVDRFNSDCQKQGLAFISTEQRYHLTPEIYAPHLKSICVEIEESDTYKNWLQTQSAGLEDKIYAQIIIDVEILADKQAQVCLTTYPTDTQLNRVRFKTQRDNCLMGSWTEIEVQAIKKAKQDPLVQRVNLSFDSIIDRMAVDRRRLQLKVMKKYFL